MMSDIDKITIDGLIGEAVRFSDYVNLFIQSPGISAGDKTEVNRKFNDFMRTLEKIRVRRSL